jgi:hypothetical protein
VLLTKHCSGDKIENNEIDGTSSAYVEGGGEVYTGFWWGNLRERDRLEDGEINERITLRRIFRKYDVGVWTGFCWLRKGTGVGHL